MRVDDAGLGRQQRGGAIERRLQRARRIAAEEFQSLDTIDLALPGDPVATRLEAGVGGIVAAGDNVVASSQRLSGSQIEARLEDARVSLDAGSVGAGTLAVTANSQETNSLGNDGATTLTLTGAAGGGGIVTLQKTDAASPIAGRSLGTIRMTAQAVDSSDLSLADNQDRAFGTGNQVDNKLTITTPVAAPRAEADIASIVPAVAAGGDPVVNAGYAVLSSQETGGTVKVLSGSWQGARVRMELPLTR